MRVATPTHSLTSSDLANPRDGLIETLPRIGRIPARPWSLQTVAYPAKPALDHSSHPGMLGGDVLVIRQL